MANIRRMFWGKYSSTQGNVFEKSCPFRHNLGAFHSEICGLSFLLFQFTYMDSQKTLLVSKHSQLLFMKARLYSRGYLDRQRQLATGSTVAQKVSKMSILHCCTNICFRMEYETHVECRKKVHRWEQRCLNWSLTTHSFQFFNGITFLQKRVIVKVKI